MKANPQNISVIKKGGILMHIPFAFHDCRQLKCHPTPNNSSRRQLTIHDTCRNATLQNEIYLNISGQS